ncbi:DUF1064 domain-containing protein [bacterium]|nr:MAG: DUF1064 domain-containing protein [bacterium]
MKLNCGLQPNTSGDNYWPSRSRKDMRNSTTFKKGHSVPIAWRNKIRTRFLGKKYLTNKKIRIICLYCKKEFSIYPSRLGRTKYCSKICYDKSQIGRFSKENNPRWKGGEFKGKCEACGKIFISNHRHKQKYCSIACARRSQLDYRGEMPRCSICDKLLTQHEAKNCYKHRLLPSRETVRKRAAKLVGKMPKNMKNKGMFANIKSGYYLINGKKIFFRSKWEANYALYLDFLVQQNKITKWEYEPDSFIFHKIQFGTRSYRPDFKVCGEDGNVVYHEVKGYLDPKSKTKLKRMRIYYPHIKIRLVRSKDYLALRKQVGKLLNFF